MRITSKLLKQFGNITYPDSEIVGLIKEHIGEVDYHHELGNDYKDIVVAQIKTKADHPDADKLGVYQIEYGTEDTIQVVAGDKSLNVGDKVAYLKVGSIVPYSIYTESEPFEIKAVKLRGVLSNGMLGSQRELNVGSNHERVLVLPEDAPVGESFSNYYDLDDTVIEIENKALTNRGDLFGVIGISRELTAISGNRFESPSWFNEQENTLQAEDTCLNIEIINDAETLCPRYTAVVLDNITVSESPIWIKSALIKCGLKPINNVVDITNYISLLLGQPMHAFDFDKLVSLDPNSENCAHINIRMARQGEKILGLDDKTYELDNKIMVIADSTHPIAIAGIIGGKDTEVDENTKRVVFESANFDKSNIRRSSMQLGVFTEAGTKFKHYLDPHLCLPALIKAVEILKESTECKVASNVIDIKDELLSPNGIQLSLDHLNSTLGIEMDTEKVKQLLENMEYSVEGEDPIIVTAPTWRTDISIKEDIYEDIGRIHGFNNIKIQLPNKEIRPPRTNKIFKTKRQIREILSNTGANETLTYSFTDSSSFKKCNLDNNLSYILRNPLSPELSLMRTSIVQSLLSKTKENMERGIDKFALYEFNISHLNNSIGEDNLPIENWSLGMVLTSSDKYKIAGSAYYAVKEYLEKIMNGLNISNIQYDLIADTEEIDLPAYIKNILPMYDPNRAAIISTHGVKIGVLGELNNTVKDNFKLPSFSASLEVNINELIKIESSFSKYEQQPSYPCFTQDLCFEVDTDTKYIGIEEEIHHIINSSDLWGRVECLDIYQSEDSKEKKKITYRITASNYNKTLTDKDIKEIVEKIKKKVEEKQKGILL